MTDEKKDLLEKIECLFQQSGRVITVVAPMFTAENITDGYFQRIKSIDESILNKFVKIYLNIQEDYTADIEDSCMELDVFDDLHYQLRIDPRLTGAGTIIESIINNSFFVYVHCALRVIKRSTGNELRNVLLASEVKLIWDVHGAVPEEFALYGDYWGAQEAGEAEAFLAKKANVYIAVNEAMKEHLTEKYRNELVGKGVVLPIFSGSMSIVSSCDKIPENKQKLKVIYAGGIQKWQKIEEMQAAISQQRKAYEFYMCVPNPKEFMRMWGRLPKPSKMKVEQKSPAALFKLYEECHYGFVLRDQSVVNRVACPTKLIEYIKYEIVPVFDTPNIGDFKKFGIEYIALDDFVTGKMPSEQKRKKMVRRNRKVLSSLRNQYETGIREMRSIVNSSEQLKKICELKRMDAKKETTKGHANRAIFCENMESINTTAKDIFYICDTLDIASIADVVGVEKVYCTCGIDINGIRYGHNKEELLAFLNRNHIVEIEMQGRVMLVEEFLYNCELCIFKR